LREAELCQPFRLEKARFNLTMSFSFNCVDSQNDIGYQIQYHLALCSAKVPFRGFRGGCKGDGEKRSQVRRPAPACEMLGWTPSKVLDKVPEII